MANKGNQKKEKGKKEPAIKGGVKAKRKAKQEKKDKKG